ncbi:protein jag [Ruminococcaceae bacterium OttesenSCG-928-L11]|nr:protein jag [Ruminococcaceae bacterium OttesenSCG-928-L11]
MPVNEIIETGKSVEAAIESACEKLGCPREECQWEIIDLPKRGFLGLKNIPAKVKVWLEVPEETKPAPVQEKPAAPAKPARAPAPAKSPEVKKEPRRSESPRPAAAPEKRERSEERPPRKRQESVSVINTQKIGLAEDYLKGILKELGLEAELSTREEDGGICINIEGKGLGAMIGRRGETLDAIQYLTSLVANRIDGDYMRITIDCGDYRMKRKETLEALARKLASQVLKTNVSRTLEPMNPFERRIIHATISEIEGVSSTSTGEEPNRRVVITTPTAKSSRGPRSGSGPRDRGDRNDRGGRGGRDNRDSRGGRGSGPRRDSGGSRRPAPSSPPKAKDEPPKQTPEAAIGDEKALYSKIDLE